MGKNLLKLETKGLEEYAERLDKLGGDLKATTDKALKQANLKVTNDTINAMARENLPAKGKYSTGETIDTIVVNPNVDWEGMIASVPVGFDFSNTEAVLFTKSLITEYAQFFYNLGCRSFDMGGDELLGYGSAITTSVPKWQQLDHWKEYAIQQTGDSNAVAYDAFLLYMNDVNSLLRNIGYTETRMWNDQIFIDSTTGHNGVVELNKDISIQYWLTTKNTPLQIMQAGHDIYNFISPHNYYVLVTDTSNFTNLELCQEWLLQNFSVYSASEWEYKVKGSAFCVWCDNPTLKTEDEIKEEILPLLSARIEKN